MIHRTFDFKGTTFNYQDEGSGDVVIVFLHGFLEDLRVWAPYVYSYMRSVRVIAIDLLGHGESGCLSDIHSMDVQAEMVKAVLDRAKVSSCVMIGHSMGGYVTLAFAKLYPQCLKGFCLLNSHALNDGEEAKERRRRTCDIIAENRAGFIVKFIPNLFAVENRAALSADIKELQEYALCTKTEGMTAAQKGMLLRPNYLDVLQSSKVPVLFIIGKHDNRISLEPMMVQSFMPEHCEVLALEHAGHMCHIEAKEILKFRLLSFAQMCFLLKGRL